MFDKDVKQCTKRTKISDDFWISWDGAQDSRWLFTCFDLDNYYLIII